MPDLINIIGTHFANARVVGARGTVPAKNQFQFLGELAVGRAMQRYGGYLMDVANTPMSVSFERDRDAGPGELGPTYSDAGFRWDYDAMENIPWDRLRVLK